MKKAAFLFFRVEVGNAACAVQYLVVVQTMLVRCPKNLDFTVFQKVSLSNLIFINARHVSVVKPDGVRMSNGDVLPISRSKYNDIKNAIFRLMD